MDYLSIKPRLFTDAKKMFKFLLKLRSRVQNLLTAFFFSFLSVVEKYSCLSIAYEKKSSILSKIYLSSNLQCCFNIICLFIYPILHSLKKSIYSDVLRATCTNNIIISSFFMLQLLDLNKVRTYVWHYLTQ